MAVDIKKYLINPYNFVRYSKKDVPRGKTDKGDVTLTGAISCTLSVKTPLSIPDTASAETVMTGKDGKNEHKMYPFFSLHGEPVIPGSEVRGMIRNVYETITSSCFSVINSDLLSYRRSVSSTRNWGVICYEGDRWVLKKAERKKAHTQEAKDALKKEYAGKVYFEREWKLPVQFNSADSRNKINYSIFELSGGNVEATVDELNTAVSELNTILDLYYEYAKDSKDINTLKRFFDNARPIKTKSGTPVCYTRRNGRLILTPAYFSREIYQNRISDILGSYCKCTDKKNLCPACRLFGTVGSDGLAVSSKVRFSDAKAENYDLSNEYCTLKILSSPKTTAHEFYATADYDDESVMLKGRKYYLHYPKAADFDEPYKSSEKTNQNASVKLVKSGSFGFKIYFDGISEAELKNLILAVTLGENSQDSELAHKLGHGKPLGLGSVKITADKVEFRTLTEGKYAFGEDENFNEFLYLLTKETNPLRAVTNKAEKAEKKKEAKYSPFAALLSDESDEEETDTSYINADKNTLSDLLNVCNFNLCGAYRVSYPIINPGITNGRPNDTASHKFFSWMRNGGKMGKNSDARSEKCKDKYLRLPKLGDAPEDFAIPVLKVGKNGVIAEDAELNAERVDFGGYQKKYDNGQKQSKICIICGKTFRTDKGFNTCFDCHNKNKRM